METGIEEIIQEPEYNRRCNNCCRDVNQFFAHNEEYGDLLVEAANITEGDIKDTPAAVDMAVRHGADRDVINKIWEQGDIAERESAEMSVAAVSISISGLTDDEINLKKLEIINKIKRVRDMILEMAAKHGGILENTIDEESEMLACDIPELYLHFQFFSPSVSVD